MSEYYATVKWERGEQGFLDRKYSRAHEWHFDGGVVVPASSSPHIVPIPMSSEANVDPEEAFIASLSSCHMLFFLDYAARAGLTVNTYIDQASGTLAKNADGKLAMTEVILKPKIVFEDQQPSKDKVANLHEQSHHACFIANSVHTQIKIM